MGCCGKEKNHTIVSFLLVKIQENRENILLCETEKNNIIKLFKHLHVLALMFVGIAEVSYLT